MQISVIKDAGIAQATQIFAGVYGVRDGQGRFQIDQSLRQVAYLFSLVGQPGVNIAPGLNVEASDTLNLDVPDSAVPFVQGVLLNAMSQRWNTMYEALLSGVRVNSVVRATLENDAANTMRGTQNLLRSMNLSLFEVPVTMDATTLCSTADLIMTARFQGDENMQVEDIQRAFLPNLATVSQTMEQINAIVDCGPDALGKSVQSIATERAAAATQAVLTNMMGASNARVNPEPADEITEIDLSEITGAVNPAPQAHTEPVAPAVEEKPFTGNFFEALTRAGIAHNSPTTLRVDMNAVLYLPAKNALEAAQMVGLIRHLAQQSNDPMLTSILTPIPKSMQNVREGAVPVSTWSQNDNDDDGDGDDIGQDRPQ